MNPVRAKCLSPSKVLQEGSFRRPDARDWQGRNAANVFRCERQRTDPVRESGRPGLTPSPAEIVSFALDTPRGRALPRHRCCSGATSDRSMDAHRLLPDILFSVLV